MKIFFNSLELIQYLIQKCKSSAVVIAGSHTVLSCFLSSAWILRDPYMRLYEQIN